MRHAKPGATVLCCVLCACVVSSSTGCDLDWREESARAVREGQQRLIHGEPKKALQAYRRALELNPYSLDANLNCANVLAMLPGMEGEALAYYRRCAALRPADPTTRAFVEGRIDSLSRMIAGDIEDPVYAMEDFLWTSRIGNETLFTERLSAGYTASLLESSTLAEYMNAWRGKKFEIFTRTLQTAAGKASVIVRSGDRMRDFSLELGDDGCWVFTGWTWL